MSEASKDLFGKIDALFEKRAPDALVDKGLDYEDFPVLTEVIGTAASSSFAPVAWGEPERRVFDRRADERRHAERRCEDRRQAALPQGPSPEDPAPRAGADRDEVERLVASVERRLADLFIRQQVRLEEVVRKVVREEMEKKPGPSVDDPEGGPRE